jgi:hypothetical protein
VILAHQARRQQQAAMQASLRQTNQPPDATSLTARAGFRLRAMKGMLVTIVGLPAPFVSHNPARTIPYGLAAF